MHTFTAPVRFPSVSFNGAFHNLQRKGEGEELTGRWHHRDIRGATAFGPWQTASGEISSDYNLWHLCFIGSMWDFFLGEAGATSFLPSPVTFYEMKPFAHLLNMRISILSLGLRGERVVSELKRRSGSFLSQKPYFYNKHGAAFIMITILPSKRTGEEASGRRWWLDTANSHVNKFNQGSCSEDTQQGSWKV